jgi:hypothetical protein
VCAILGDDHPLAGSLAQQLTGRGWRVVTMTSMDSEDALRKMANGHGRLAAFIDVRRCPQDGRPDLPLMNHAEEARLKSVFLAAKHLGPVLTAPEAGRTWFIVVTHVDGKLGLGDGPATHGIVSAGIPGLLKTLRHEWPSVFCRAVDLHPELHPDRAAELVAAELEDADLTLAEVGHGPEGRCTIATFERADV